MSLSRGTSSEAVWQLNFAAESFSDIGVSKTLSRCLVKAFIKGKEVIWTKAFVIGEASPNRPTEFVGFKGRILQRKCFVGRWIGRLKENLPAVEFLWGRSSRCRIQGGKKQELY